MYERERKRGKEEERDLIKDQRSKSVSDRHGDIGKRCAQKRLERRRRAKDEETKLYILRLCAALSDKNIPVQK